MALKSMEWFKNSILENEWFNMMSTWQDTTPQVTWDIDKIAKNKEVEIWLGMETLSPMTDEEKQKYVDWLTDYQYWQMQKYKDQWYSFEAAKALVDNADKVSNSSAQWYDKYTNNDSNAWVNVIQGILDVPLDIAKFPFRMIDKWAARLAKQFSDNDDAIDELLQENLKKIDNFATLPWVDRDSLSYQLTSFGSDLAATIATSFIPFVWEAKWAEWATKYPKLIKLINNARWAWEIAEKYPWLSKLLKWWAIWVKDTVLMNALEWEWTTPLEAAEWWGIWAAFEKWTQWLKRLGAYIWINWLIKPSEAENIIRTIKERWVDVKWDSVEKLAEFLTKNWLTWTRKQIQEKALNLAKNDKKLLTEILNQLDDKLGATHDLLQADEAVEKLLNWLKEESATVPNRPDADDIAKLEELLTKKWKYTLTDLEDIKSLIDKHENIYKKAFKWVRETKWADNWNLTRVEIKKYIEKVAKEQWYADVEMLNNTIQVSNAIAKEVENKWLHDSVNWLWDYISAYWASAWTLWLGYWIYKDLKEWDVEWALLKWWWILLLRNTYFKTRLGSLLQRMWWTTRDEVQKWIDSWWRDALSESASKEISDIIKKDKELYPKIKELWKNYMAQFPKEAAIVWWQKWVEEIVDSFND